MEEAIERALAQLAKGVRGEQERLKLYAEIAYGLSEQVSMIAGDLAAVSNRLVTVTREISAAMEHLGVMDGPEEERREGGGVSQGGDGGGTDGRGNIVGATDG